MNVRNLIKHPNHVEIVYTEKDCIKEKVMKVGLTILFLLMYAEVETQDLGISDIKAHHIQYLVSRNLITMLI